MKCWFCNSELRWSSDFSFEDYCMEGDGIVAVLNCTYENCNAVFEGYLRLDEEEE